MNMNHYTVSTTQTVVPVANFRRQIERLERKIHVDYSACADKNELGRWAAETRRVASDLIATGCKRAKVTDWDRRERAIERATDLVAAILFKMAD